MTNEKFKSGLWHIKNNIYKNNVGGESTVCLKEVDEDSLFPPCLRFVCYSHSE